MLYFDKYVKFKISKKKKLYFSYVIFYIKTLCYSCTYGFYRILYFS